MLLLLPDSEHGHRFNELVSRISLSRPSFAAAKGLGPGQLLAK